MKNYPHLYPTPISKKVTTLNRTPKKKTNNTTTLTTKPSNQTLLPYHMLNREKRSHLRNITRSIQTIKIRSDQEEETQFHQQQHSNEDEELFSQSYSKIGRIRQSYPHKNIDAQLNEVLNLIREEKALINQRMRALKRSNQHYKQLCQGYMKGKLECGVNTEDVLESGGIDEAVQCEIKEIKIEEGQDIETENSEKTQQIAHGNENYLKMCRMLQQMNINPKDILPLQKQMPKDFVSVDFTVLSEPQIIQIQKFFIKKLIEKLPK